MSTAPVSEEHPILLFDGLCPLCHAWVRILLQLDTRRELRFARLQSVTAQAWLHERGYDPSALDTVVLLEAGSAGVGVESDAVLGAIAHLGLPWNQFRHARHLPRFLRDRLYRWIARHRRTWFGRYESCPLPPTEDRERFLDLD